MSARPSSFKGGGGFLTKVVGTIVSYKLTDSAFGPPVDHKGFTAMHSTLGIRLDGADDALTTNLFAGNAQDFDISDNGRILTPNVEGYGVGKGAAWSKFVKSLIDAGFDENNFPDTDELNWTAMIGARCEFDQVVDESAKGKKRQSKQIDPKTGKPREFDITRTIVSKFLGMTEVKPAKGGKVSKVAAAAAPKGKAAKAVAKPVSDLEAIADYISGYLSTVPFNEDGVTRSLPRTKLRMRALTDKAIDGPTKTARATTVSDVAILSGLEDYNIVYDAEAQTVTLA